MSTVAILTFSLSSFPSLFAEDYPSGYLEPGYRKYLGDKIREGYYVEVFVDLENRQKERVEKRKQIEDIVSDSYQANLSSAQEIIKTNNEKSRSSQEIDWSVKESQNQAERVATAQTEFKYIKYSDGKIVKSTDGLPTTIENERVLDEFGNLSIKNTYNMKYNDKRLLTSYEATLKDNLGNITQIYVYGIEYSSDSIFYGGYETKANRNEMEKYIQEIDSAGNVRLTHWKALEYDGKMLRAFHQDIEDSIYGENSFTRTNITYENDSKGFPTRVKSYHEEGIGTDGLSYTSERKNITYNGKDQVIGYYEEVITTNIDASQTRTINSAQFKYLNVPHQFGPDVEEPDPDMLSESIITTTIVNPDGSEKTETTTTKYDYDSNQRLVSASGYSIFLGQEAKWYEYTDTQGHILSRNVNDDGYVTYSYVDPDTLETVIVPADQVTATLRDGDKYKGSSDIQYEILADGRPAVKQVSSSISYYGQNIKPDELIRIEETTTIYNNALLSYTNDETGLTFYKVQVLDTQEHTETTYPLTDPENNHKTILDISTTYFYDEKGNLIDTKGEGSKTGWEYSDERGWWGRHTSKITVEYDVILGKAVRTVYDEEKDYE